ncbi:MAG: FG-GAP repeat protein, partial [Bacteroidales bacterium]|nr:FG-GAP repeat protein [Bacteroidales bacterium]
KKKKKPVDGWRNMTETHILEHNYDKRDAFGCSVGISGETMVVGASSMYNGKKRQEGLVYVYQKKGEHWLKQAELSPSKPDGVQWFGTDVGISGTTIIVGTPYVIDSTDNIGAAYIFKRTGSRWGDMNEKAILTRTDTCLGTFFGYSVNIHKNCVVVGAPSGKNSQKKGAVFIYEKPAKGWANSTANAMMYPETNENTALFGYSVAIKDSVVAVGGSGEFGNEIFVFEKEKPGWESMTPPVILNSEKTTKFFGVSMALSSEFLLCGGAGNSLSGSVTSFRKRGSTWKFAQYEKELVSEPYLTFRNRYFGWEMSASESYVAVAMLHDDALSKFVTIYKYNGQDYKVEHIIEPWCDNINKLGEMVCLDDSTLALTVSYNNSEEKIAIFEKGEMGWSRNALLNVPANFIEGLKLKGNVLVVSISDKYHKASCSGYLALYEKPAEGWIDMKETAVLYKSGASEYDNFARYFDVQEDVVFASYEDFSMEDSRIYKMDTRAVCIFEKPGSGWGEMTETTSLYASVENDKNFFGKGICAHENTLAVGTTSDNGAIYLFAKDGKSWQNATEKAIIRNTYASEGFPSSLCLNDSILIVGDDYLEEVYCWFNKSSIWSSVSSSQKIVAPGVN